MIGIYFSGTGNTRYCVETFMQAYYPAGETFSIEAADAVQKISMHNEIVLGYPVQFSNIPKILQDFIVDHSYIWKNKTIFIIATMALFSGDGAGILARLLIKQGAVIVGGLHLKMPDSICDEKVLKRSFEENKKMVAKAEEKIYKSVGNLKKGKAPQEGLGIVSHLAGLFGQRLYFWGKTKKYTDKLKIDSQKCIGCGLCEKLCPMRNIAVRNGIAVSGDKCTMCYRCINKCPKQSITLLGKKVIEQNQYSLNKEGEITCNMQ